MSNGEGFTVQGLSQGILCDCSEIEADLKELGREIEVVTELSKSKKAIYENALIAVSQDEFNERNNSYLERHRKATERAAELEALRIKRREKHNTLESFIRDIETRSLLIEEFDEKLWLAIVDNVNVLPDGRLVFTFV